MLLFTVEDGTERVYEHVWFTFPWGLYKDLFERVNDLSWWDPRDTQLHYLAELTGATLRQVRTPARAQALYEIELAFTSSRMGEPTKLIFGGLDLTAIPAATPEQYERGWQVPLGIGNPGLFESCEQVLADSPLRRSYYGFHLDTRDRWIDHHAVGVDGPLLYQNSDDPSTLHLYLLSYERHALLNHFVITCPKDACPSH